MSILPYWRMEIKRLSTFFTIISNIAPRYDGENIKMKGKVLKNGKKQIRR